MNAPSDEPGHGGEDRPAAPPLPVEHVVVVGLGLMGGSLAHALKSLVPAPIVRGMTPSGSDADAALEVGAVDAVLDAPEELQGADLVVYATPLSILLDLLPAHAPHLGDSLISDVASLKGPVVEAMRAQGLGERFVGAHPMAGAEASGFGASRPGLFRGAAVYLTRDTGSSDARRILETFWRSLDTRPAWIDAAEHDRRMVWASHLPQLVANVLARSLEGAGMEPVDLGPGGRDMTRLAASSPALWSDILAHAAGLDAAALRAFAAELEAVADDLEGGRLGRVRELMEETRSWRRGMTHP